MKTLRRAGGSSFYVAANSGQINDNFAVIQLVCEREHAMELSRLQIEKIIDDRLVDIHFQPIVSHKGRKIVGVEALMRCFCGDNGYVPPNMLFAWAAQKGLALQLDRLCREKALEGFAMVQQLHPGMRLFLNIESSIIDKQTVGSGHMVETAARWNIDPSKVIIEINEAKVNDIDALRRFVRLHRQHGFALALDDIGYGHSNLERITHVKPEVLKIDRSLCREMDKDFYKQEIFKSLIGLARRTGALVVAEGVETKEEVLTAMGLGVDMLQGYYFAKPNVIVNPIEISWDAVVAEYRDNRLRQIRDEEERCQHMKGILAKLMQRLAALPVQEFEHGLRKLLDGIDRLECLYILDRSGCQVTVTIGGEKQDKEGRWPFRAADPGADQSLKQYFLHIQAGKNLYISEPYMSSASGENCITCASLFRGQDKEEYILCADFSQ